MNQPENIHNQTVINLVTGFCQNSLDEEYKKLCLKAIHKLLKKYPAIFDRGKKETWAAAIVWAIGSANFLDDKSFQPYASLSDVCGFFSVNASTVGQKASKIRDMLQIDIFNRQYLRSDSGTVAILDRLQVTPDGFIVMKEPPAKKIEISIQEESKPENHTLKLISETNLQPSNLYQLEYIFKKLLRGGEKLETLEKTGTREVVITFLGSWDLISKLNEKLRTTNFRIV